MPPENTPAAGQPPAAGTTPPPPAAITTVEQMTAAHPALVTQVQAAAATAERERITAILGAAKGPTGAFIPGHLVVALEHVAKPESSAGDAALAILAVAAAPAGATGQAANFLAGLAGTETNPPPAAADAGGDGKPALGAFLGNLPKSMVRQPSTN